ncbi:MAG: bifunctional pyr operon transcriptional regulator/uracil phosphoribosyltransferase PyrR [Gemmatimonadales bacterium]|nr:MAG: bifunctional pyr operon transcriptional regulator/uracil phosphoribosyltransferase PyrR [Gemmatimonadales bacterium]
MSSRSILLDERAFARALTRMASEIVERCQGTGDLVLVGIQRRGVDLAQRLAKLVEGLEGRPVATAKLDITLYRDDLQAAGARPVLSETDLPDDLDGRTVVIVDDVLHTGRTIRAAMDELADFGRPKRILLCVLVDRGGRELPIQPDIAGLRKATVSDERIDVSVLERDGQDRVELVRGES